MITYKKVNINTIKLTRKKAYTGNDQENPPKNTLQKERGQIVLTGKNQIL